MKYANVVSGGEGMTMVVRISGGASGYIHPPMMFFFTNSNRSYPIRGIEDNVAGACYRTGPKGWMDQRLFRGYLKEGRAMSANHHGLQKTIFLDNCSGHLDESECQEVLKRINARLRYLPPNATDLCEPADSFVIAKIKDVRSRMWNNKKIQLIGGKIKREKVAVTLASSRTRVSAFSWSLRPLLSKKLIKTETKTESITHVKL